MSARTVDPIERSGVYRLGVIGAGLGVVAGLIQLGLGDEIPAWTGNKLHPVQLGLITIALSLASLGCLRYLEDDRQAPTARRAAAAFVVLATVVICFTTVGRLWYLPGPLLLISLVALLRRGG